MNEKKKRLQFVDFTQDQLKVYQPIKMPSGEIRYTEKQSIKRGGTVEIDEQSFTLTDEYKPYPSNAISRFLANIKRVIYGR